MQKYRKCTALPTDQKPVDKKLWMWDFSSGQETEILKVPSSTKRNDQKWVHKAKTLKALHA